LPDAGVDGRRELSFSRAIAQSVVAPRRKIWKRSNAISASSRDPENPAGGEVRATAPMSRSAFPHHPEIMIRVLVAILRFQFITS
jgi:hypothetical protein